MNYNTDEINLLFRNRRSIFPNQYSEETIKEEIIQQILENANWAPNHKLTEPWRFSVFSGEGRRKLGILQAEHYKKITEADGSFSEKKRLNLEKKPLEASHIIVIGLKHNAEVREVEEVAAVSCAVQNMYLTATAYGLGCYWGTGGITYMEGAQKLFGWGEKDRLLGFFYLGHFKESLAIEGKRNPIDEKVTWVRS